MKAFIYKPSIFTGVVCVLLVALCVFARVSRGDGEDDPVTIAKHFQEMIVASGLSQEEIAKLQEFMKGLTDAEKIEAVAELQKMDPDRRAKTMRHLISMPPAVAIERSRKRDKAAHTLQDLRLIDSATDQYAIETNRTSGEHPTWADLQSYLKRGTELYNTGADPFGNKFGPFTVDSIPLVPSETFNALSDVADATFWSPFK